MKRRTFIASLATGALAAPLLADNLTVTLPKIPEKPLTWGTVYDVDHDVLLWAIAERESGFHGADDSHLRGPAGELSRYQITRDVWSDRMERIETDFGVVRLWFPFFLNCHGERATDCAHKHLRWLDANLPRQSPSEILNRPYVLAWAWTAGRNGWIDAHRKPQVLRDKWRSYAEGVANLYEDRLRVVAERRRLWDSQRPNPA